MVYYCDGKYNGCVVGRELEYVENYGDLKERVFWGYLKIKIIWVLKYWG